MLYHLNLKLRPEICRVAKMALFSPHYLTIYFCCYSYNRYQLHLSFLESFISVVGPLLLTVFGTIQVPFCLTPQRLRRFAYFRECNELCSRRLHSSLHSRKGDPPQVARRREWLPISSIYLHEKRQINRAVYLFRSSLLLTSHCLPSYTQKGGE